MYYIFYVGYRRGNMMKRLKKTLLIKYENSNLHKNKKIKQKVFERVI